MMYLSLVSTATGSGPIFEAMRGRKVTGLPQEHVPMLSPRKPVEADWRGVVVGRVGGGVHLEEVTVSGGRRLIHFDREPAL